MSEIDTARISRVESEVEVMRSDLGTIKQDMSGVKASMRGFGEILSRIEQNVASAQERQDHEKLAARLNPVALASILISIISILVGGSWLISGELARTDERSQFQARQIDTIESRQWQQHNGGQLVPPDQTHQ